MAEKRGRGVKNAQERSKASGWLRALAHINGQQRSEGSVVEEDALAGIEFSLDHYHSLHICQQTKDEVALILAVLSAQRPREIRQQLATAIFETRESSTGNNERFELCEECHLHPREYETVAACMRSIGLQVIVHPCVTPVLQVRASHAVHEGSQEGLELQFGPHALNWVLIRGRRIGKSTHTFPRTRHQCFLHVMGQVSEHFCHILQQAPLLHCAIEAADMCTTLERTTIVSDLKLGHLSGKGIHLEPHLQALSALLLLLLTLLFLLLFQLLSLSLLLLTLLFLLLLEQLDERGQV